MSAKKKCVLAYSGGLDTSIMIPWLREERGFEVHCLAGDVGQGAEELEGLEEKALATGAASCQIVDLVEPFLTETVWPALRALAVYEGRYLLGTSLARPVLARAQALHALDIGAQALAHGCTGKGNDQVRFELAYLGLAPDLEIIAPWREWDIESREDAIDYAAKNDIRISVTKEKIYSRDRNLWHISHEGGAIENPGTPPVDEAWMLTVDPKQAPNAAERLTIQFKQGIPVAVDGQQLDAISLLETLNERAARHGVGRITILENRLVGMKSRGQYETPGGTVLYEAMTGLQALVLERELMHLQDKLAHRFAEIVYNGQWFAPERAALEAFFRKANEFTSGEVCVELYKGHATALSATSPYSLFREDLATFGASRSFEQRDAEGFIKLYGLPLRVAAEVQRGGSAP